uniref:HYR domain-containing protein n=1 Tax=Chromera velia CCMP2878 TaxID=1169474 RepID=A0A0G4FX63_9ALVE|eukprot:Cvel_19128.t1-p1 / transcript=Cvel_19128.t1 / gene=Cvel_19128 / organism=Chromera_velia_CCMP2878 / gene_product=Fibrillin-1, putative / transcript_product=Fibrillin-1, putative / location=Cvel_scaffold1625:33548-41900(-) / protein_length=857 / sequence_SO=supercontig / SO=protein_coding / is_pseudo=false
MESSVVNATQGGYGSGVGHTAGMGTATVEGLYQQSDSGGGSAPRRSLRTGDITVSTNDFDVSTTGFRWDSRRGASSTEIGVGDINGDGVADIAVKGSSDDEVRVLLGRHHSAVGPFSTNAITDAIFDAWDELTPPEAFRITGTRLGAFKGIAIGDMNGDGYGDILFGESQVDSDAGFAWVVYGRATFPKEFNTDTEMNATTGFTITSPQASSQFGINVAMRDISGDGVADMMIGATGYDNGPAYTVLGQTTSVDSYYPNPLLTSNLNASSTPTKGFKMYGTGNSKAFCEKPAVGDINGDGYDDIGCYLYDDRSIGGQYGAAYFFYGRTTFLDGYDFTGAQAGVFDGTNGFKIEAHRVHNNHNLFQGPGMWMGDINKDGVDDVAIPSRQYIVWANEDDEHSGANVYQYGSSAAGAVWIFWGKRTAIDGNFAATIDMATIADGTQGFRINGGANNQRFGAYMSDTGGDVNGDGTIDIAFGAFETTGRGFCAESSTNNCDTNAECNPTLGSFACTCNYPYVGDGVTCTDYCASGQHNCDANRPNGVSCRTTVRNATHTAGSFTCTCNTGYDGDGLYCNNFCGYNKASSDSTRLAGQVTADPANNCDGNATCAHWAQNGIEASSFTCSCNAGYSGIGTTTDGERCGSGGNECTEDRHTCDTTTQVCVDTLYSFTCVALPAITCPPDYNTPTDRLSPAWQFETSATGTATSSDTTLTYTFSPEEGTFLKFGTNTIIVTGENSAGSQTTCTFKVIVGDDEKPTVQCPASLTLKPPGRVEDPDFFPRVTYPDATNYVLLDNVDSEITPVFDPPEPLKLTQPNTFVKLTGEDSSGNKGECEFAIIVEVCPTNSRRIEENGDCKCK